MGNKATRPSIYDNLKYAPKNSIIGRIGVRSRLSKIVDNKIKRPPSNDPIMVNRAHFASSRDNKTNTTNHSFLNIHNCATSIGSKEEFNFANSNRDPGTYVRAAKQLNSVSPIFNKIVDKYP